MKLQKGHTPWNKKKCFNCGTHIQNHNKRCRKCYIKSNSGRNHPWYKNGFKKCEKCKKRLKHHQKNKTNLCWECYKKQIPHGKNHPNWKGGLKHLKTVEQTRKHYLYQQWRTAVFKRDDYTCQKSKQRGGKLVAHHIESFDKNISLRLEIKNGITLNKDCHNIFHNIYGRGNNNIQQLEEFLTHCDTIAI